MPGDGHDSHSHSLASVSRFAYLISPGPSPAVDATRPSYLDSTTKKRPAREAIARVRRDPRWHTVFDREGVTILSRS